MEKGIESSSAEIIAELGESGKDELDHVPGRPVGGAGGGAHSPSLNPILLPAQPDRPVFPLYSQVVCDKIRSTHI